MGRIKEEIRPLPATQEPQKEDDKEPAAESINAESVVAGMAAPLQALRELLLWPIMYAKEAKSLGLRWPKGLLLYGPPGTGKVCIFLQSKEVFTSWRYSELLQTSVVHAVARECNAHVTSVSGASVHKAYAGESEKALREAFNEAASEAATGRPAIIFIDEIDTMCPPRDSRRQQEAPLVAQLLTLMDGVGSPKVASRSSTSRVVVVAATNRVKSIDPASRRPGRFDREIAVPPPNAQDPTSFMMHKDLFGKFLTQSCYHPLSHKSIR